MSQNERIINWMKTHDGITSLEAVKEFGCLRLSARIAEIKQTHLIETERVTTINRYGDSCSCIRYRLKGDTDVRI